MRLLAAALLLLLLALCASRVDGECREGPLSRSCPVLGSPSTTEASWNPGGPGRAPWAVAETRAATQQPGRSPAGSKCKCSRKGPKIRYSDVKKLEMKPKYPHCEEKMVM